MIHFLTLCFAILIASSKRGLYSTTLFGSNPHEAEIINDVTLGEAELRLIKIALERTNRNVSKAARELGITRMALRYRIKKYNL